MDYERTLIQLGFTRNQAKLYLTLLKTGEADAKTLFIQSQVPRPIIYRTLQELQEKGLVEKIIAAPYKYNATPINEGLSVLIKKRLKDYQALEERAKELMQQSKYNEGSISEKEPRIIVVQGKERLIKLIKSNHDNVKKSVDLIVSNWRRLLQILHYCLENYKNALERGVQYRVIVNQPDDEVNFLGKLQDLMAHPNFTLRLSRSCMEVSMAVFDMKVANFVLNPAKKLGESPLISTNHPLLIAVCKSHFNAHWKKAANVKVKSPKAG